MPSDGHRASSSPRATRSPAGSGVGVADDDGARAHGTAGKSVQYPWSRDLHERGSCGLRGHVVRSLPDGLATGTLIPHARDGAGPGLPSPAPTVALAVSVIGSALGASSVPPSSPDGRARCLGDRLGPRGFVGASFEPARGSGRAARPGTPHCMSPGRGRSCDTRRRRRCTRGSMPVWGLRGRWPPPRVRSGRSFSGRTDHVRRGWDHSSTLPRGLERQLQGPPFVSRLRDFR